MADQNKDKLKKMVILTSLLTTAGLLSWNFLMHTNGGCYNRAFSIGSAFCHQIPTHSFHNGLFQFPVCARCAGLYIGSFICMVYGFLSGKKARVPSRKYLVLMAVIFFIWAGDGLNSLVSDLLRRPFLYQTTNLTRLATGLGMGLVMSTALVTLFNVTIWENAENQALLRNINQVFGYAAASAVSSIVLLFTGELLFQTAAFITILSAIAIITLLYTIFWVIILKKENIFKRWKELGIFLLAGFCTAAAQIILLTTLREGVLF